MKVWPSKTRPRQRQDASHAPRPRRQIKVARTDHKCRPGKCWPFKAMVDLKAFLSWANKTPVGPEDFMKPSGQPCGMRICWPLALSVRAPNGPLPGVGRPRCTCRGGYPFGEKKADENP